LARFVGEVAVAEGGRTEGGYRVMDGVEGCMFALVSLLVLVVLVVLRW